MDTDDTSGRVGCAAIDAATDHTNVRPEHESRSEAVCQSNDPSAVLQATYSTDHTVEIAQLTTAFKHYA